jgi:uncharacterized protein (DUF779 family)
MFFQSGGCCDGSAPMCYAGRRVQPERQRRLPGQPGRHAVLHGRRAVRYWEHTQLIIDVVDGNGGMFSLDNGTGRRFLTRSRLFTDEECAA